MKRIPELVILAVAAIVVLTVLSGYQGVQARSSGQILPSEGQMQRLVSVSGTGRVEVQPDMATIQIGVETQAETASEALQQNNTRMQALLDALAQSGVASEDIQTQSVQLFPIYSNPQPGDETGPVITGYTASNIVMVRVRDLEELGTLLDTAVEAGGNRIHGISFEVSQPQEAMSQAREQAFEDARAKGNQLASLAGGELGGVVSISESSFLPPPIFTQGGTFERDLAAAVPVSPGVQTVEVTIQVAWQLTGGEGPAGPATTVTPSN